MASPPPSAMDTFASLDTSWTLPLDTSLDTNSASRKGVRRPRRRLMTLVVKV